MTISTFKIIFANGFKIKFDANSSSENILIALPLGAVIYIVPLRMLAVHDMIIKKAASILLFKFAAKPSKP